MKKLFLISLILLSSFGISQNKLNEFKEEIESYKQKLRNLSNEVEGLTKQVNFNISNTSLPTFVRALGKESEVNLSINQELESLSLTHTFSNAKVEDIIIYLCKEFKLSIDITGNIISIKKYVQKEVPKPSVVKNINVEYNDINDLFTVDLQNDTLSTAFKKITDITGKNLVYSPSISSIKISGYIKNKSFESAIDKIAFANNLRVTKTKDGYYLFEEIENSNNNSKSNRRPFGGGSRVTKRARYQNNNFHFKVLDSVQRVLEVDFENVSIENVINEISYELDLNVFTSKPLNDIGIITFKSKKINFDELLNIVLKNTSITYKHEANDIYIYGENSEKLLVISEVVPLMYRSIEVMNQPIQSRVSFPTNSGVPNTNQQNSNINSSNNSTLNNSFSNGSSSFSNRGQVNTQNNQSFGNYSSQSEALVKILPKHVTDDLEVKTDIEHNTFIVTGNQQNVLKFKKFIKKIDKPVPVILIEVMILEVSKSNTLSSGLEFGIGDKPVNDSGKLFSSTDLTLGANTINKIIGGFNGFGSLNVGKVMPNFYANIQAMETNGNIKIRSTPKLSTLNGHQATLSNGVTSYYAVTRRDVIGSQNPQTTEIKNYYPIDANLSISIKPLVSGNGQITLGINVLQSSFNGERIDAEAPPGMNSREFTSTIRVKNQDVVILGGLEENVKNNSGSGVPFLARIPIIKWFFSKRTRSASKSKLSVLIRPTIIK